MGSPGHGLDDRLRFDTVPGPLGVRHRGGESPPHENPANLVAVRGREVGVHVLDDLDLGVRLHGPHLDRGHQPTVEVDRPEVVVRVRARHREHGLDELCGEPPGRSPAPPFGVTSAELGDGRCLADHGMAYVELGHDPSRRAG